MCCTLHQSEFSVNTGYIISFCLNCFSKKIQMCFWNTMPLVGPCRVKVKITKQLTLILSENAWRKECPHPIMITVPCTDKKLQVSLKFIQTDRLKDRPKIICHQSLSKGIDIFSDFLPLSLFRCKHFQNSVLTAYYCWFWIHTNTDSWIFLLLN